MSRGTRPPAVAVAAPVAVAVPNEWRLLWRRISASFRNNTRQIIISSLVAAALGFVVNIYLIFFEYDGYQKTAGTAALGEFNLITGSLFWILAMALAGALANYWYSVGTARFFKEIRELPEVLRNLVSRDGHAARTHILWGAAAALLAGVVIAPCVCGIMALALLSSAPSVVFRVITSLIYSGWNRVTRAVSPAPAAQMSDMLAVSVGLLGSCAALAVNFILVGGILKLILAGVCAAAGHLVAPARLADQARRQCGSPRVLEPRGDRAV